MAKVGNNIVTANLRGKVGNIVFRTRNGKTHAYMLSKSSRPKTDKQKHHQQKFRLAVQYAKDVIANPDKKQLYTKIAQMLNKESAYNAALSDYMQDLVFLKVFEDNH